MRPDPGDPWDAERFERALAPFLEEYEGLDFTPRARQAQRTRIRATSPRRWDVSQVLCDPLGDDLWAIHAAVDLGGQRDPEGPILRVLRIGP